MKTLIMKFGGASVATPSNFFLLADLIHCRKVDYSNIVVVVSAMGKTTDQLLGLAREIHPSPPQRELDMLLSAGERISMSLLAMALCRKGSPAVSFTGSQSGIITCGRHTDAQIVNVTPARLKKAFSQEKIVIVAGFQGVSLEKEITTLGRGGSDTSAVALGVALEAEKVEFYKDVPGIFDQDPKKNSGAICYSRLTYQEALSIANGGAKVLHSRAIQLAAKNGLTLHVKSFQPAERAKVGTIIQDPKIQKPKTPEFEI
ncbi:MAG: aspartate kinase [Parachlamydia sp.]|jgi:aspartate kinase|nr:aspartate kinase [Parachlamydia sp.]